MRHCNEIHRYKGTKSQILMRLIDEKLRKQETANLIKYVADEQLNKIYKEYKIVKEKKEKLKMQLNKRKAQLGIEWSYNGKYEIDNSCRIPSKVSFLLQKASDLSSIGKNKEANVIYNKLVKEYRIGE